MTHSIKVLVAEDDPDDQDIFLIFLGKHSNLTLLPFANNGIEVFSALNLITDSSQLPDIILLDQNMPRLTGHETLVELKSNKRFKHIPVVVYSTYVNEYLTKLCIQDGATMVIPKPSSRKEYEVMINRLQEIMLA